MAHEYLLSRQFTVRVGFALLMSMMFAQSAVSQERAAVNVLKAAPVKSKKMPENTTLKNICNRAQQSSSTSAKLLTIRCSPVAPSSPAAIASRPTVQRSDINCKYTENDEGGLDVESCTCSADSDSNCTNFITWCAKQGGDVGGNNQSATCN